MEGPHGQYRHRFRDQHRGGDEHHPLTTTLGKTLKSGLMTGYPPWYEHLSGIAGVRSIQLAGHLHGRALQEWNLMDESDNKTWDTAIPVLRKRLDQETKILAAQDFRHTAQGETEKVADFIRRLERTFRIAYG